LIQRITCDGVHSTIDILASARAKQFEPLRTVLWLLELMSRRSNCSSTIARTTRQRSSHRHINIDVTTQHTILWSKASRHWSTRYKLVFSCKKIVKRAAFLDISVTFIRLQQTREAMSLNTLTRSVYCTYSGCCRIVELFDNFLKPKARQKRREWIVAARELRTSSLSWFDEIFLSANQSRKTKHKITIIHLQITIENCIAGVPKQHEQEQHVAAVTPA
jgi:hypothetical protein